MRRALVIVLFLLVLVAIDATFDGARFTIAIYDQILEFGRVVNRTITQGS